MVIRQNNRGAFPNTVHLSQFSTCSRAEAGYLYCPKTIPGDSDVYVWPMTEPQQARTSRNTAAVCRLGPVTLLAVSVDVSFNPARHPAGCTGGAHA